MTTTINASTSSGLVTTPDNSGTIALQSNGTTKATISSSGFYAPGAVVQVLQGQTNTLQSFGSGTWTDLTGLTATITPQFSTSKVLVQVVSFMGNDTPSANVYNRLQRNGTTIGVSSNDSAGYAGNAGYRVFGDGQAPYTINTLTFSWLDSPASTSALVYKVQGLANAGTTRTNQSSASGYFYMYSTITLMEVAA